MSYEWVTDEMFDEELIAILRDIPSSELLRIKGIYEILKEEFNDEVLSSLEKNRSDSFDEED